MGGWVGGWVSGWVGRAYLHKQIRNPESIEQVAGPCFFLPVVFPQVQHLEDVCVPRFYVDSECAGPLPPSLVDVAVG